MEENKIENIEIKSKNKNTGLIITVIALVIVIFGLIGYISYDKLLSSKTNTNEEGNTKSETIETKLTEEEVKELHKNLVSVNKVKGFYFKDKVTIDTVTPEQLLPYILLNYAKEKGIDDFTRDLQCHLYQVNCEHGQPYSINKADIDNYIKSTFNTTRVFTINDSDTHMLGINTASYVYDKDENKYYLGMIPGGTIDNFLIYTKFIKYEQENDNVYIYDNAFIASDSCYLNSIDSSSPFLGVNGCYSGGAMELSPEDQIKNEQAASYAKKKDSIFIDYESNINTYKHTFKKASNGNYYWYSSEIVK